MEQLEKQIQTDMVSAMKAKDAVRLAALRGIKAAILLAKTSEGGNGEVTDSEIVKIIQKLTVRNSQRTSWQKLPRWKSTFRNS